MAEFIIAVDVEEHTPLYTHLPATFPHAVSSTQPNYHPHESLMELLKVKP
jgi:hypothetical protein